MKNLVFEELLLLSLKEKKAKRIQFHPEITILMGGNSTGKSSIVKSIYRTIGAEPIKIHLRWFNSNIFSVLKFRIDNNKYSIFFDGRTYSLFDKSLNIVAKFDKPLDLGASLANLLDFKIKLNNLNGDLVSPPPAYYFLPFFVNQDISWNRSWASFKNLNSLRDWKKSIIEYHTGIHTNKYYELKDKIDKLEVEINSLQQDRKISVNLLKSINEKYLNSQIDIDIDSFKNEIQELMIYCRKLKEKEDHLKENLVSLYNAKANLEIQISIVENAIKELKKDYYFALNNLPSDNIECPTCGAIYDNSFKERFDIALDEDNCINLLFQLKNELININEKIFEMNNKYRNSMEESKRVQDLLDEKKDEIEFRDVVKSEGNKEIKGILRSTIDTLALNIIKKNDEKNKHIKELYQYNKNEKDRQTEIIKKFNSFMRENLRILDVNTFGHQSYKQLYHDINETGSNQPRALLAYYYSILHIMYRYSSCAFAPIVIDTPNQQGQDITSLKTIIHFIRDELPNSSQLILAIEDLHGIEFKNSKIYNLESKYSVLNKIEFSLVNEEIAQYINKSFMV